MFINKNNKNIYTLFLILFLVSFSIGYYIMDGYINNSKIHVSEEEPIPDEIPNIEIIKEENRITPNTFIEERIHYKECGHLISNVYLAKDEMVNLTEDELVEYLYTNLPSLDLISFSNLKVVLWGEKNHLCKDHYIVGEENGKIAIFSIDEDGKRILDKVFVEYPINILINIDQEKIKEGIIVNSEDELSNILQDYIS
ncbi:MAG: BofC C-terminal domain-containing protein [Tissierellia bacterium]|nr:BofC C-terminal domain-containing protein [Tissierellia bacterium]MDD4726353.1 BofC C-terminal domain-containing protein [Tissierellia bacterium]